MKDRSYYYHKKRSARLLFKYKRVCYNVCKCFLSMQKIKDRYMSEHKIIELRPVVAVKELQGKINKHGKHNIGRVIVIVAALLAAIIGTYLILTHQTYSQVKVTSTDEDEGAGENQYVEYNGGYLKYGRDGASLVDKSGDESWNQPYQMQNPIVEITGESAAIADNGGNSIVVLDKSGLKGEMETLLPIEKISVSEEGVVAALMKDETAPSVICYDATGNVLVEHKASVSSTGYPLDVAISKDGYTMAVSYLYIEETEYKGRIIYYNFGEEGQGKTDNIIGETEMPESIIPSVYFINNNTSVAIGDGSFMIHKEVSDNEGLKTYKLDKTIASTFHTKKYIGFLLQNSGSKGYELRVYNLKGKVVMSENVRTRYSNIKMIGRQIYMYEGERMSIYSLNGVKHFEGNVNETIISVFPAWGINKYRMISADGFKVVRLVR